MDGDTFAFALLMGVPLFLVSCVATLAVCYIFGQPTAWFLGGTAVVGWPIYYIAMTSGDAGFIEGLPLLLFTLPPMAAGWLIPLLLKLARSPI